MAAKPVSQEQIKRARDLTEAACNLAGPVNDPWFDALQNKVVTGEISGDEAAAAISERYGHRWSGTRAIPRKSNALALRQGLRPSL